MKKNKIFVQSYYDYKNIVEKFGKTTGNYNDLFSNPKNFKLVLFSGGADVNPILYNHKSPNNLCHYDNDRDYIDTKIFKIALKNNIKMVGICRGLQFLNVMSGGTLLHHINNHEIESHSFISPKLKQSIVVNSLHHQMVLPHKSSFIIGSTKKQISTIYFEDNDQKIERNGPDIEALYMPSINACGIQYHPEMMDNNSLGVNFFHEMVNDFLHLKKLEFTKIYTNQNNKEYIRVSKK